MEVSSPCLTKCSLSLLPDVITAQKRMTYSSLGIMRTSERNSLWESLVRCLYPAVKRLSSYYISAAAVNNN